MGGEGLILTVNELLTRLAADKNVMKALSWTGVFLKDSTGGNNLSNQFWTDSGFSPEEFTGDLWLNFLHPDDKESITRQWRRVQAGETDEFDCEFRIRDSRGDWHWIRNRCQVVTRGAEGKPEIYIGVDQDLTALREELARMRETIIDMEQRYLQSETLRVAGTLVSSVLEVDKTVKMILEQAHQVVPFDTAAVCRYSEGRLEIIGGLGWENLEKIKTEICPPEGDTPHFRVIQEQVPAILEDLWDRYGTLSTDATNKYPAWLGVPLIFQRTLVGILEFRSKTRGYFKNDHIWPAMAFADNVAVALSNARIYSDTKQEAHTDSLTGLFTRRFLHARSRDYFPRRNFDSSFVSIIMMDIDHFKRINDTFGHSAGDVVLREIAQLFRATLRKSDICCRYGGEELAVLLPNTDKKTALFIAERMRGLIEANKFPELTIQVTASFGVSSTEDHPAEALEELIEEADKALYSAKDKGRNRVETIDGKFKNS